MTKKDMKFENVAVIITVKEGDIKSTHQVIIPEHSKRVILELLKHDDGEIKLLKDKLELTIGKEENNEKG